MSKVKPNRKRKNRLFINVNDAELTMIHDRMDRCGYHNLGEYARRMMIDGWNNHGWRQPFVHR